MSAHAIVIGIDRYAKPEWSLTGAVRDAVAFARWCVTAGDVDPKDLTLLLSADPGGTPLADLLKADQGAPDLSVYAQDANEDNIREILREYRSRRAGDTADRLWFYYAGHGLAPPAASPNDGPVIVPADIDNLEDYLDEKPIALEIIRGQMADVKPNEQFFFVDACRDVLEVKSNKSLAQQLIWDVRKLNDEKMATQCVLFATTAGNKAKEIRGNGLFSRALMAALRGLGPELKSSPPGQPPRKRLLFNNVTDFVIEAVKRDLINIPDTQPSDLKAVVPYGGIYRLKGDVVVAEFVPEKLPKANVSAILKPKGALSSARIEFLYQDANDQWVARPTNPAPAGPPVDEETPFVVQGGIHYLQVTADGFEKRTSEILVYEDKRFSLELKPAAPPPPAMEELPMSPGGDGGPAISKGLGGATTATIIVESRDRLTRVAVVDASGNERGRSYGRVYIDGLAPGLYYARAELTGADRNQQLVTAEAGHTYTIPLDAATEPAGPTLTENLKESDINVAGGFGDPSENFGEVANVRLGSILAYAAWAARWPESKGFYRLRNIGVDRLPALTLEQSALQVLVGDVADPEASFARECRVQVESSGAPLVPGNVVELGSGRQDRQPLMLESLAKLPAARQTSALLPPGAVRLRVEMPGFAPASFALTLLRGFVTVLVISREENGEIDVQQYFNPIDPMVPVHPRFSPPKPDDVRLVELGWRALQERESLDEVEYRGLLEGKRSNPLLAIIAGYRMFGTEREYQFRGLPEPPPPGKIIRSALWNMVTLFPGLPDVHVLAGLYNRERRDEHFERAMHTGTPVMVEGFWTLVEWLTERAIRDNKPAPTLRQSVLPGMVWTSFTEAERARRVESVPVITPAGRTQAGDASDMLAMLARSVARLELSGGPPDKFLGTAFLVAPDLVICPVHFADKFAQQHADGSWTMRNEARVRFDLADPASERIVVRALRTLRPSDHLTADSGTLPGDALPGCWPVLLQLSEPAAAAPLVMADEAPDAGRRVAVIGFPRSDTRIPSDMFAAHFAGADGEKHVMTGAVLRSPGSSWTFDYDCFTAEGTSGGPVVDLQTGDVVGMHVAASKVQDGRKRGLGIAMTRFSEEQWTLARQEEPLE